jgi:hypothetical protein
MSLTPDRSPAPIERWRLWLGRLILLPLVAMVGAFIYALYTDLMRGEITVVSRGYRSTSRSYTWDEHPIAFVLSFSLYTALALLLLFATWLVARRVLGRRSR